MTDTPKKKRKRSKKDPNKPKRGVSAYNFFFKETRIKILASISSESANISVHDEGQSMASNDEKINEYSKENCLRCDESELPIGTIGSKEGSSSTFDSKQASPTKETIEVTKDVGDSITSPEKMKKRRKPVIIEGKISFDDLAKEIGRRWKELSNEKRAPYIELAKEDAVRFSCEIAAYNEKMKNEAEIDSLTCVPIACKEEHELSHCVSASIMENTAMGEQFRVSLGAKETEVIFCRARKVADDHTTSTAFLTPVGNIYHGADLICSHPLCRLQGEL